MKILVVENRERLSAHLRNCKAASDSDIIAVNSISDGLQYIEQCSFDLLILSERMLPGNEAWGFAKLLKNAGEEIPILLLPYRDAVLDNVKGQESKNDKFLPDPMSFSEMLVRVCDLVQRENSQRADFVQVADMKIDCRLQRAYRGSSQITLTPREFALLALLASRIGETFSRAQIADLVLRGTCDNDSNVVAVYIRRLRAKVDDPFQEKLIHTVRGSGYFLAQR